MLNVDSWQISIHCLKCSAKNKATLAQVKRGETIQCAVCSTKIGLNDNDGSIEKQVIHVQEEVDSLELVLKKIRGSLDV
jgi:DNA-directed RNA polymerase subunit RPC12/RpoP